MHEGNGGILTYYIDSVKKITFTDDSLMPYEAELKTYNKDSIVLISPTGNRTISLLHDSINVSYEDTIGSFLLSSFSISQSDSITFTLLHNDNVVRFTRD